MNESIDKVATLMRDAKKVTVLTGAGVSTGSGLPDFRSQGGLWNGVDPREIASIGSLDPRKDHESESQYISRLYRFIKFYGERMMMVKQHTPNIGHDILARWEETGIIHGIVTQNVDGYHELAGSMNLVELHGSLNSVRCQACGDVYSSDRFLRDAFCACMGLLRPNVVLLGENIDALPDAQELVESSDLMLVLGSTLTVKPANLLPFGVRDTGGKVVIINMEPTQIDPIAEVVINNADLSDVLVWLDTALSSMNNDLV